MKTILVDCNTNNDSKTYCLNIYDKHKHTNNITLIKLTTEELVNVYMQIKLLIKLEDTHVEDVNIEILNSNRVLVTREVHKDNEFTYVEADGELTDKYQAEIDKILNNNFK